MARRPRRQPRRRSGGPTKPKSFRIDTERWLSGATEQARLRFVSICIEAHSRIVERSPVDTGYFRASWGISINESPPPATVQRPADFGAGGARAAAVAEMTARLAQARLGDVVWVYNPVVYGPRLEHGHSAQAPQGMVLVTFHELSSKYGTRRR